MKRMVFFLAIIFILLTHPVSADMYRYEGDDGAVHFTDNLASVPLNQRAKAVKINASEAVEASSGQRSSGETSNNRSPELPKKENSSDGPLQPDESLKESANIDRLLKIKTALDAEHVQIVKESLALSEEKKTLSGNAEIQTYNEKVNTLNARIADYEKRRALFQKDADSLDAAVKKQLAAPPQSPQPQTP